MRTGDLAADRQAEPAAAGVAPPRPVDAEEAVEDALPVLRRDARAVVGDGHAELDRLRHVIAPDRAARRR